MRNCDDKLRFSSAAFFATVASVGKAKASALDARQYTDAILINVIRCADQRRPPHRHRVREASVHSASVGGNRDAAAAGKRAQPLKHLPKTMRMIRVNLEYVGVLTSNETPSTLATFFAGM